MNIDELHKEIENDRAAVEYALNRTGSLLEGFMFEYKAEALLKESGFTNIVKKDKFNPYVDYEADRSNTHYYISVKLHGRSVLNHLSYKAKERFATFIKEADDHFLILSKEGLTTMDQRTKNRLERYYIDPTFKTTQ
jgi:hypothetical protein